MITDDDDAMWRRCEIAWSEWLQANHYAVTHLGEALGNSPGTNAPLIGIGGVRRRAPDLLTTKSGLSEYWEIKYRSRADRDALTGDHEHWMSVAAFGDYLAVADSGSPVWLMLYEGPSALSAGRWLRADIRAVRDHGHQGVKFGHGGGQVRAWIWPVHAMEVVPGPRVEEPQAGAPLLPNEDDEPPIPITQFEPFERALRKRRHQELTPTHEEADADRAAMVLANEAVVGLDVLRRSLGIPALPRYSVLRVGGDGISIDDLLGILEYGIRVFLITAQDEDVSLDATELQAYKDSRLLEWAIAPEIAVANYWVVDGQLPKPLPTQLEDAFTAADGAGGMNIGQYEIVHAPRSSDVLVTAGAGTGKTETMSERLIFLLATSDAGDADQSQRPPVLRADDVVLMTFTREAAREMRARIARTLMLRQRLSPRCVLPALAWMMQLSNTEISTIHAYAKRLAKAGAGAIGLAPGFSVARQTIPFRRILYDVLSPHLDELFASHAPGEVPAAHLWQQHLDAIWGALENNGIDLMPLAADAPGAEPLDWGEEPADDLGSAVARATQAVIQELAARFRDFCLDSQSIPTAQLVPTALAALQSQDDPPVRRPKFLFVDEFQDTDALQMDLMLEVRTRLGARMFVVGDAKQGVYRFRGAEGNAFEELRARVAARGLPPFQEHRLTRNFRTGRTLLDSLHPYFQEWGESGFLPYADPDRLLPNPKQQDQSDPIEFEQVPWDGFAQRAAVQVAAWRGSGAHETIAVLCRRNWQAIKVQAEIRAAGGSCELLVGGSFFTSPVVRELRVLLEGVSQPDDDAALLELCETRWAAGILHGEAPPEISDEEWDSAAPGPISSWRDRLVSIPATGTFSRADLAPVRKRLVLLAAMLNRMPVLAWIVECGRVFTPEACALPTPDDDSERRRYARGFDHLITVLDSHFQESPATLESVLDWLRIQIATNRSADEPVDADELEGRTTALTVHKAKGLEFDRVLIPSSWTKFEPPASVQTRVAVLREGDEVPRVIWRWSGGSGTSNRFSNGSADGLWAVDSQETMREEARLLYVALTRAKAAVRVFVPRGRGRDTPNSWADLLARVGA